MNRISKIFLAITILLQLCWILPWCYSFLFPKMTNFPFTLYSEQLGDFLSLKYEEETGITRIDTKGNVYSNEESDSLLPFFYIRQLMAYEKFPKQVNGIAINPREVNMTNFMFRSNPSDINCHKVGLYPLLESLPKRVDLEMSDDVFRTTEEGIEFVVMETNRIDEEKSGLFTKTMKRKGFVFPASYVAGNPSTRKEYDEGYLLLDRNGDLFHFKQTCGRPFIRKIERPDGLEIKHMFITEFSDRKTLGFITGKDNRMYALMGGSYKILPIEIPSFDPQTEEMTIIGNMMTWTICISSEEGEVNYAVDAEDFRLLQTLARTNDNRRRSPLTFTSYNDKFVKARFMN